MAENEMDAYQEGELYATSITFLCAHVWYHSGVEDGGGGDDFGGDF